MTRIRLASRQDLEAIRNVHLLAFPEGEGQVVAELAVSLLAEKATPETIALVAQDGSGIVGHIAFSPVTAKAEKNWLGYILAPLGVKPLHQKGGIGKNLVESGIVRLTEKPVNAIFVYGDPSYYGRYGFSTDAATKYLPPYRLQYPSGWQAIVLNQGGADEKALKLSCVSSLCDPALW